MISNSKKYCIGTVSTSDTSSTPTKHDTIAKVAAFCLAPLVALFKTLQHGVFFIYNTTTELTQKFKCTNSIIRIATVVLLIVPITVAVGALCTGLICFTLPKNTIKSYNIMKKNDWDEFKTFIQKDLEEESTQAAN